MSTPVEELASTAEGRSIEAVPSTTHPSPTYNFQSPPYLVYTGDEFESPMDNSGYLKGCKWAPDGSCLLTNSADSILRVFNAPDFSAGLPTSALLWTSALRVKEVDLVYDYCWYPKMSSLDPGTACFVTTSKTAPVHLWDAFLGTHRASYIAKNNSDSVVAANSVAMSPDGTLIYAGYANAVRVFDIAYPGEECAMIDVSKKEGMQGGIISAIAFDPSGTDIVAFGSYNRSISLCSSDGDLISTLDLSHTNGITQLHFSPDGRRLYSAARIDDRVFCWDLRTRKILREFYRETGTNQRVYFDVDPAERWLCSGTRDGKLKVWALQDIQTSKENNDRSLEFAVHSDMVNGVSFHPQWSLIATASGQRHVPSPFVESEKSDNSSPENTLKLWYVG